VAPLRKFRNSIPCTTPQSLADPAAGGRAVTLPIYNARLGREVNGEVNFARGEIPSGGTIRQKCIQLYQAAAQEMAKMRHLTKFREDRSNHCRHRELSFFSNMAPVAILDLLCACLDHPQIAFGGVYRFTKFRSNRFSSFNNKHVSIFYEFGLKIPIHAHFGRFWGTLTSSV